MDDFSFQNLFRQSGNIEDRRKEKFMSHPQAPQMPNVFWDPLFGPQSVPQLDWRTDFEPQPQQPLPLSKQAGAGELDVIIQKYLSERK